MGWENNLEFFIENFPTFFLLTIFSFKKRRRRERRKKKISNHMCELIFLSRFLSRAQPTPVSSEETPETLLACSLLSFFFPVNFLALCFFFVYMQNNFLIFIPNLLAQKCNLWNFAAKHSKPKYFGERTTDARRKLKAMRKNWKIFCL